MDRHVDDTDSFSGDRQRWELEQREIKKVAARFPQRYREDLEAELAVTLIKLKRSRRAGIRNRTAYQITAFWKRALTLVEKWRKRERRETSIEFFERPAPSAGVDTDQVQNHRALAELRHKLNVESYGLLMLWAALKRNQSRLARLVGKHRNTIGHRLRQIWPTRRKCPIDFVSARLVRIRRRRRAAVSLTAGEWEQLAYLGEDTSIRRATRARLILGLAMGQTYSQIARSVKTTAPTIARWKRRFEKYGMLGLEPRHQGRRLRVKTKHFAGKWRRAMRRLSRMNRPLSCRKIARQLGISKSTAHRYLKAGRA